MSFLILFSNVLCFVACIAMLVSILVLEKRTYVFGSSRKNSSQEDDDDSEEAEDAAEAEDADLTPKPDADEEAKPMTRMCAFGCCPLKYNTELYYSTFTNEALTERKSSVREQCNAYDAIYKKAYEANLEASEHLQKVTSAYKHLVFSAETVEKVYDMRCMYMKVAHHTLDELYLMLSAIRQWKGFQYAPNGMYPEEKQMWENVVWKRIEELGPLRT